MVDIDVIDQKCPKSLRSGPHYIFWAWAPKSVLHRIRRTFWAEKSLFSEIWCNFQRKFWWRPRNSYFRKVAIEKLIYFKNLFTKHKNDVKKTLLSINLLLCKEKQQKRSGYKIITAKGRDLTEPVAIANHFNNCFSTVAENLVKKISSNNTNPSSLLARICLNLFIFTQLPNKK